VHEDGRSFPELARKAASDPQVLDRLSVNALAEDERRVLAVLALAGGALLPEELIAAMGDVAMIGERLGLLRRRGLVEQHEDRFGLPICHVGNYREMLLRYVQLASALRALADWLSTSDPGSEEARSAAGGALGLLGIAAERAEWPGIVRLVRLLEPVLTLLGRWEASREALEHGLAAARATGDQAAEALSRASGRTVTYHAETLDEAYASRAGYGAPHWEVTGWVTTYAAIAAGELDVVSDAVATIGGHPPMDLAEFLRRNPATYRHLVQA